MSLASARAARFAASLASACEMQRGKFKMFKKASKQQTYTATGWIWIVLYNLLICRQSHQHKPKITQITDA